MNPSSTPVPAPLRLFRSLVIIALVLVWTLIAALGLASSLFSGLPGSALVGWGLGILLPPALAVWAARRQWLQWPVLGAATLGAGAILAWLAWDREAVRHPMNIDEVAPAFDGAERSYAVILEYGKQHPTEESKAFSSFKGKVQFSSAPRPEEPGKWVEFLTKNRAGLEADWAAAAPQRAWLDRLNAYDRLGDLTPADFAADIPRFDVWRFLAQRSCAIASLQAIDGHGDEAVATLLPMLEVARKFETSSRTLVRLMISRVAQKLCCETAGFILDRANPGPAARRRLLAALQGGNSPAGARRIVLIEYAVFGPTLLRLSLSESVTALNGNGDHQVPGVINLFTPFLINPHATANLYGDYVYALADLAEARDLGGFAARQEAFMHSSLQNSMKNLGGRLLLNIAVPAYQKILKTYWDIEDLRAGLVTRLKPPA